MNVRFYLTTFHIEIQFHKILSFCCLSSFDFFNRILFELRELALAQNSVTKNFRQIVQSLLVR